MSKKIKVGIIGAGRIGKIHAQHIVHRISGAELGAIADIQVEAAKRCASELDIPLVFEDYRKIIENPDIDAVIICSSTDTHTQIIEEAAEAKKHIFCEKPIDFDLKRIDRALKKVEENGVKLQIGFNRRFDPNFRRAWEFIQEGRIGEPHILRITSRDPEPPPIEYVKVSGGIFLDMTIHDFDMARYLMESEAQEIYAVGDVLIDSAIGREGDLDTVLVTIKFRNKALGTIDNSRKAVYGYDQRVEVFGSRGMIAVSNNKSNTVTVSTDDFIKEDLPPFFFMDRYIESYIAEMKAFINCIINDETPSVTGTDGRIAVVMGKAAKLSYDENRPVGISEIS